jgi:hypothetical protein
MTSINRLIDPLLDRLAARLAVKVQTQLDGAFDAALQRAEQRLEAAALNLETRLVDAATRAIVGTGLQVGMESTLDRTEQIIDATEKALEATMFTAQQAPPRPAFGVVTTSSPGGPAAVIPSLPVVDAAIEVQQQLRGRITGAGRPGLWPWPERPDR